jgi:hypothetical protein
MLFTSHSEIFSKSKSWTSSKWLFERCKHRFFIVIIQFFSFIRIRFIWNAAIAKAAIIVIDDLIAFHEINQLYHVDEEKEERHVEKEENELGMIQ